MTETPLERVVPEQDFAQLLLGAAERFSRLTATLVAQGVETWGKRDLFELQSEADELEATLDDFGARWNQTFHTFTELVASIRGFSLAGLSLEHLHRRYEAYGVGGSLGPEDGSDFLKSLGMARSFVFESLVRLFDAWRSEAVALSIQLPAEPLPKESRGQAVTHFRLPRTIGQETLSEEAQRIAEVTSKYLQACEMLEEARLDPAADAGQRDRLLHERFNEEKARVYEATVHNLQSSYDTHIKNTVREGQDERLPLLRGHVSVTLHLLEAATHLTHFIERHENGERTEQAKARIAAVVPRDEVTAVILDHLVHWAQRVMRSGVPVAEQLLPNYTNVQALDVELADGLTMHARPASLVVAIVNHHGTPVEIEVRGQTANAASILEMMILVGSHPEERCYQFRGDENPLRDLRLLFEAGLGEQGLDLLPDELGYLRR